MADYYTDASGTETRALRTAFLKALDLAGKEHTNSMIVAVQDSDSLNNETFESLLGKDFIKELKNGSAVYDEVTVFLQTYENTPDEFESGPMLASHISPGLLSNIEKSTNASSLIYIPTSEEEMERFKRTHPTAHLI